MKTYDILVSDLCEEIDFWKERANHFERLYEEERNHSIQVSNERMKEAKKGVATALMFALSCSDAPDGSLIINRENRKDLANHLKQE